jgi:hypothetical protein
MKYSVIINYNETGIRLTGKSKHTIYLTFDKEPDYDEFENAIYEQVPKQLIGDYQAQKIDNKIASLNPTDVIGVKIYYFDENGILNSEECITQVNSNSSGVIKVSDPVDFEDSKIVKLGLKYTLENMSFDTDYGIQRGYNKFPAELFIPSNYQKNYYLNTTIRKYLLINILKNTLSKHVLDGYPGIKEEPSRYINSNLLHKTDYELQSILNLLTKK